MFSSAIRQYSSLAFNRGSSALISGQVPHFQGCLAVTVEVDPFGSDRIRLHFQNPGDCL
jgi:hypothetical protein